MFVRTAAALPLLVLLAVWPQSAVSQEQMDASSFQVAQRGPDGADPNDQDGKKQGKRRRDGENRRGAKENRKNAQPTRQGGPPRNQNDDKAAKRRAAQERKEAERAKRQQLKQERAAERAKKQLQKKQDRTEKKLQRKQDRVEKKLQKKQERDAKRSTTQQAVPPKRENRDTRQARPHPDGRRDPARAAPRRNAEKERARQQRLQEKRIRRKAERPADADRRRQNAARRFEDVRKKRAERVQGKRRVLVEPDDRVIVRGRNRTIIRNNDNRRFRRAGRELRRERRKDGMWMVVTAGLAGALIYTLQDEHGRVLRRSRRDRRGGREMVLFDNRRYYYDGSGPSRTYDPYDDPYVDLPPPRVSIPRDEYIVEYDEATVDDIYDALMAPPVEDLDRKYSLDEVRYSYNLLERMRRVDLDAVNFDFGSWEVTEDQYDKLERVADAMLRILEESPDEMFLLEGHTDAPGSEVDNLSLGDRRAEAVAIVLTDEFEVPPENLMTQGYGEYHLKVETEEPMRANRRVAVRRITPLLDQEGYDEDEDISSAP